MRADFYGRAEPAVRAAAAAAAERPAAALGPKEAAEVEVAVAFFRNLASLVTHSPGPRAARRWAPRPGAHSCGRLRGHAAVLKRVPGWAAGAALSVAL